MNNLFTIIFIAICSVIGSYIILYGVIVNQIRIKYPELWEKLGKPKFIYDRKQGTDNRFWEFIKTNGERDFNDEILKKLILVFRTQKLAKPILIGGLGFYVLLYILINQLKVF